MEEDEDSMAPHRNLLIDQILWTCGGRRISSEIWIKGSDDTLVSKVLDLC